MILSVQTFIDSGLPTASDISEQEISFAIKTVEQAYLKPRLGGDLYNDILTNPSTYVDAVKGTNTVAGLELALEHLVYGYMLYDMLHLTRYASVIKDDEHSHDPELKDIRAIASQHWELGEAFVAEVCEFLQAPTPKHPLNNLIFGELMFNI